MRDGKEKRTGTSIKVMLDRKSESGSSSSTRACWPQFPTIRPNRSSVKGTTRTKIPAWKFTFIVITAMKA
jgi:hypothetical protein